jgi:hypothetical protein
MPLYDCADRVALCCAGLCSVVRPLLGRLLGMVCGTPGKHRLGAIACELTVSSLGVDALCCFVLYGWSASRATRLAPSPHPLC